jgi:hypothetical protein
MKHRSTEQAARAAKISRATLQWWIATGKIQAPEVRLVRGRAVRLWSDTDLARLKAFRGTLRPGPKKNRKRSAA